MIIPSSVFMQMMVVSVHDVDRDSNIFYRHGGSDPIIIQRFISYNSRSSLVFVDGTLNSAIFV